MKTKLLSTLFFLGSAIIAIAQIPTEMTDRYQAVMDSLTTNILTTSGEKVGVSFAITIPGYGSWQGVSGQSDDGVNFTTDMTTGIASNGKLFTAVIMLRLQEEGILSLDDQIGEWIEEPLPNIDKTATIRQLLLHQTGYFDPVNDGADVFWANVFEDWDRFWTYQEMLTMVEAPNFDVGTGFRYSNVNYGLAAYIIEIATGNSLSHNLHQYITEPLNLTLTFDAATDTAALDAVDEAASYTIDTWWPRLGSVAAASLVRGMGSLVAKPQDVVDFYQALFHTSFLSPESMEQLLDIEAGSGYGMGIHQRFSPGAGTDIYGHGGSYIGFLSEAFYDPKTGASFFFIYNSDQVTTFYNPFLSSIYREFFPKKANDSGISRILSPRSIVCQETLSSVVELKNFGSTELTSVIINYQIDNGTVQTHSWNGDLASGQTTEITLPAITSTEGNHVLNVWTTAPNGSTEENLYNDGRNTEFTISGQSMLPSSFSEDFESNSTSLKIWNPNHSISHQWGVTHLSAATGLGSLVINNFANAVIGTESYIDVPMIQLGEDSQKLSFRYAYSAKIGTEDSLEVLVSSDCGATWQTLFNKAGTELSLGLENEGYNEYFPHSGAEWHTEEISLDAFAGSNVLIRFKQINDFGDNLFLDNIYVGSSMGTTDFIKKSLTIYPNPANNHVMLTGVPANAIITIYDMSGKKVHETMNKNNYIDISRLAAGIYILKTSYGSAKIIKK